MVETELTEHTTIYLPFSQSCPDSPPLFAVRQGVPLVTALEKISSYLSLSLNLISDAAVLHEDSPSFAAAHLLEMSKAVLDSVVSSLCHGGRGSAATPCKAIAEVEAGDEVH